MQEVVILEESSHWPFQDDPQAVERGRAALAAGQPIICDVKMLQAELLARLEELLNDYASSFESDPDALGTKLGELDVDPTGGDPMARFQELMGDPEVVLGAALVD